MTGRSIITLFAVCWLMAGCATDETPGDQQADAEAQSGTHRIIALGGSVTETVYALGLGENLVAVDISSTWPEKATELPQVGYQRTLSAENILALAPTLVLGSTEAGPPTAITQLRDAGTEVVIVPGEPTVESIHGKIMGVANALNVPEKGKELIRAMDDAIATAKEQNEARTVTPPRVLFIYSRGSGSVHVSGAKTSADLMLGLAGAENAVQDYEGFRPLTAEGVIAAAPDIILLPEKGLEMLGGTEGLMKIPGISGTPAGKNGAIITMDDLYLLGLGPRTGDAVLELSRLLHAGDTTEPIAAENAGA